MPSPNLQVLIGPVQETPLIIGLPAVLRLAQKISEEVVPERIVLENIPSGFTERWAPQLSSLDKLAPTLRNGDPVLAFSSRGLPQNGALKRFLLAAQGAGQPLRWIHQGQVVASWVPSSAVQTEGRTWEGKDDDWEDLSSPGAIARAEQDIFDGLVKDVDGYIARFDRRLSIPLSRWMLKAPITPNHITLASLLLGLVGAAALAFGSYAGQVAGALLLWFCAILDGCDGEVARLKLLCSPSGAAFDLSADHIAHLAIFVAIPLAVRSVNPQAQILLPGLLMVSGMLASMFTVWKLILSRPLPAADPLRLIFERIASRDYVYLIVALVVLQKLHWFLWAAAFGTHFFNLFLWWTFLRRQKA